LANIEITFVLDEVVIISELIEAKHQLEYALRDLRKASVRIQAVPKKNTAVLF